MKDLMKVGVFEVTTTLFHKCANGRKRKNNIISLENDGQVIEGDENLLKHASEYYTELFGPPVEYEVQMDADIWEKYSKSFCK